MEILVAVLLNLWLDRITCTFYESFVESFLAVLLNLWLVRITCTFYESFAGSFVKLMARSNNLHFLWKFWWPFC